MKRLALVTLLALGGAGCFFHHHHDCDAPWDDCNPNPPPGGWGGGTGGSGGSPAGGGYCSSDAQCGGGLICDRSTGACASPTGGCGQASFSPHRASGDILLVLDRSNSMQNPTPSGTKWTDLVSSLQTVLQDTSQVKWGLEIFPASDDIACTVGGVDIPPASGSAAAILARIQGAMPTGAGTPTRDAVGAAGQYLQSLNDGAKKYILLATDGEPNCSVDNPDSNASDAAAAIAAVQAVAQAGTSTFVIGVSISPDADATLSQLAQVGGEARTGMTAYYPAGDAHDLEAALQVVARQIALCTFDLNPAPPVGDTIELSIGGRPFPRNTSHTGDGWDFTNGGHSIALYGAACDAVQSGGAITAQYVCGDGSACDPATMQCIPTGTGGSGGGGQGGGTGGSGGGTGGSGGGTGGSGGGGVGSMCHYNAQCGPGGLCIDGMCHPHCTSSTTCGTGDICLNGNCMPNPNPPPQCTFNSDCGPNATCINATCHANCTVDANCPNPADICDHGVCQPNWHRVPSCTSNAQCANGMACVDGICRTPCWQPTDCAGSSSGSICWTGYCFQPNQVNPQCFLNADCGTTQTCIDATCE